MGIFGNSGGSSLKPVPLPSEKREKGSSASGGLDSSKDAKGSVVKLSKKSFTIEKKIAEGGFAIVYLVTDKQNRYYALKRQLIRDDHRSLEACRRESQILKDMAEHKNIVTYLDHSLLPNKAGVYDYLLLTTYYKNNVLQMMNSRLAVNKSLSVHEVLAIFCDMCEAVAGLHHHRTGPIIHRDLKVENVLIDERAGGRPIYVLCDFGSATTKILSTDHFSLSFIEEEIQKYTTLSYRAPEMIDLYSNIPIGVQSDMWALGVMLYKLCFFTLPFGESALAIQNGSFSFPSDSRIPDTVKALITCLLTFDVNERPDIYQAASIAFDLSKKRCPVLNQDNTRRFSVTEVYENYLKRFPKADTGKTDGSHTRLVISKSGTFKAENGVEDETDGSAVIVNTNAEKTALPSSNSTSVNPRLRPKPSASVPRVPAVLNPLAVDSAYCRKSPAPDFSGTVFAPSTTEPLEPTPASAHYNSSFTAFDGSQPFSDDAGFPARSKSAGGTEQPLKTSAFKPYSISKLSGDSRSLNDTAKPVPVDLIPEAGNPFLDAPYGSSNAMVSSGPAVMDDYAFGERFDEIRRIDRRYTIATAKYSTPSSTVESIDDCTLRLIETDPFGCAPISPYQMHSSVRAKEESSVQESSS
uniref:non-specific serine/threonine protein kinase n=1 Tax=Steinernema glaseri TaxID=37863 RepID=A0A1I7ZC00_9BILA